MEKLSHLIRQRFHRRHHANIRPSQPEMGLYVSTTPVLRIATDDHRGARNAAGAQLKQRDRAKRMSRKPKHHEIGSRQMPMLPFDLPRFSRYVAARKIVPAWI